MGILVGASIAAVFLVLGLVAKFSRELRAENSMEHEYNAIGRDIDALTAEAGAVERKLGPIEQEIEEGDDKIRALRFRLVYGWSPNKRADRP